MNSDVNPKLSKVLITGGTGFIGSHLVPRMTERGYDCILWNRDIFDIKDCREQVDTVVHLAAVSGPALFAENPAQGFKINVEGTRAVLDYCKRVRSKIVFASTCGVYPLTEDKCCIDENFKTAPTNDYALSKRQAEILCQDLTDESASTSCSVLRLFNVYGSGQSPTYVINYIVDCILRNKPVRLKSPYKVRDYICIQDIVQAFLRTIESDPVKRFEVFNIGSGEGIGVLDLVRTVERIFNRTVQIQLPDDSISSKVDYAIADITKAGNILGWHPEHNLSSGLNLLRNEVGMAPANGTKGRVEL